MTNVSTPSSDFLSGLIDLFSWVHLLRELRMPHILYSASAFGTTQPKAENCLTQCAAKLLVVLQTDFLAAQETSQKACQSPLCSVTSITASASSVFQTGHSALQFLMEGRLFIQNLGQ